MAEEDAYVGVAVPTDLGSAIRTADLSTVRGLVRAHGRNPLLNALHPSHPHACAGGARDGLDQREAAPHVRWTLTRADAWL
eukprot:COSAG06_NODE_1251_length_10106_cov_8.031678_9_plen_81_part_00